MSIAKADANPTKSFFVRMLTRDISLDDCILDLVDNSIDGAWEMSGDTPSLTESTVLGKFSVDITISAESFAIQDNCGGITLDDAVDYAFTFGRRDEPEELDSAKSQEASGDTVDKTETTETTETREPYSVGVYGIGMKRAIFKIGRSITIRSTYADGPDGSRASFVVPIEVEEWLADNDPRWDFPIDETEHLDDPGVRIEIGGLSVETANRFADPAYLAELRAVLARDYMLPMMHGLVVRVNEIPVPARRVNLRRGDAFQPMRDSYRDGEVTVELLAGMGAPPPDENSPDESDKAEMASGWYVLCNGRVVLAADTSSITGWGGDLPKWHGQYTGFAGLILFTSPHAFLLPMTTTKRGVDVSAGVYLRARARMIQPARAWIDYTNARKQDLEDAKKLEQASQAQPVTEVAPRPIVELPTLTKRPGERPANINFARQVRRVRALAEGFGDSNMTYRDVGIESFEYAYKMLADEDDE